MTQSFDFARPRNGLLERWGHWAPPLLKLSIAASIALGFQQDAASSLGLLLRVGLIAFVVMTWLQMRQHDRRLCESCAAAIPLNASEQAHKHTRKFATAHAGSNAKVVVPYLVVLLGSNLLLTVPHGRWPWAVIQASMIYLISAHATHRRLQPWCPWCSGGGGGTDEVIGEPDLPRGRGRQLV
jgi:hypothetical protein